MGVHKLNRVRFIKLPERRTKAETLIGNLSNSSTRFEHRPKNPRIQPFPAPPSANTSPEAWPATQRVKHYSSRSIAASPSPALTLSIKHRERRQDEARRSVRFCYIHAYHNVSPKERGQKLRRENPSVVVLDGAEDERKRERESSQKRREHESEPTTEDPPRLGMPADGLVIRD